jgi:hypothetical protein
VGPVRDHGPSIKDDERYEKLRKKGESKEKATRIANTGRSTAGKRGGKSPATRIGRRRIYEAAPRNST